MVVNPNSFRLGYFADVRQQIDPSFSDTLKATLGYNYAPLGNMISNLQYTPQRDYDWKQDIGEYKQYAPNLYHAVSPEHMAALKQQIEESISRREVLYNSSMLAQVGAGFLDPINYIALPLGGPSLGVARSAARVGLGVAAIETGLEAVRQTDPLQTAEEGAYNILAAGMFGAGFGAVAGSLNIRAYKKAKAELQEELDMHRRLDLLSDVTPEELRVPREERIYGNVSDDDLQTQINHFSNEAAKTRAEADSYDGRNAPDFIARADELQGMANAYKKELGIRDLESRNIDLKDPYRIMNSVYTDSFLYKAVTTPMKRALQSKYPTLVKEKFVKSFSDSGIALALNSIGLPTPQSVFQRAAVSQAKWVRVHDQLLRIWQEDTGASDIVKLDINLVDLKRRAKNAVGGAEATYNKWLQDLTEKSIRGSKDFSESELKAISAINDYFESAKVNLERVGLISTQDGVKAKIERLQAKIDQLNREKVVAEGRKTKRGLREANLLEERLSKLGKEIAEEKSVLLGLEDFDFKQEVQEAFFPRFWDKDAIKKNRESFHDVLYEWYASHPYIMELDPKTAKYEKKVLNPDRQSISKRVNLTIDRILGEEDPANVDSMGFGYGRSKHFRHRQIDIPNRLVVDYIVTDPLAVMKTYSSRIEPRYEYARMFGDDVDGVLYDMKAEMIRKGLSEKQINQMTKDYMHMYDRVAGVVNRSPTRWDNRVAEILKNAASFNYMGSAGIAALPDFGRIVMENDMADVIKGIQAILDKNTVELTKQEVRYAGEALDILRGSAHLRLVDDVINNINGATLLDNARNAFYIANGLAPLTVIAKQLSGVIDSHVIIDYSLRYNSLTKQELTWYSKYGFDKNDAKRISEAPFEKTKNGFYLANSDAWEPDLAEKFRIGINSGVLNTIMAATPADKPIINDGVVYIPKHIGALFGFKEDGRVKGYTRIQSGLLGLPFQFYSFVLANVNKTVGALAQGQIKNRYLGISTAIGLGYMSMSIRTPDYIWDEMSWRDRFARSFDMSGIMALYSDMFYTSMHTSLALGGPNITNGLISPKYPQQKNFADAVAGIAGAGPSWGLDITRAGIDIYNQDFGEGFKNLARNLPFARMWFLKDDVNQITRAWAQ